MKKVLMLLLFVFAGVQFSAGQTESAYFNLGELEGSIESVAGKVINALNENNFKIIGEYNVAGNDELFVICYTRPDLEKIALEFTDRGVLAATLKVGLKKDGEEVKLSMLNPMYLFYAYFVNGIDNHEAALRKISDAAITALKHTGNSFTSFGGELEKKKLQKYRYKVMMPTFNNTEELKEFNSFEEGLRTIQANLSSGKGQTAKIYELVYTDKKVAVFGVGLLNPEDGESHFLPIIGDDHIAAMPYDIILQDKKAIILPGRYRIALHWPELTMGTFMKIMSTPGDIKKTLKGLTE